MNKVTVLSFAVISSVVFASCVGYDSQSDRRQKVVNNITQQKNIEEEIVQEEAKVVELSFMDFQLNKPLSQCLKKARMNDGIKDLTVVEDNDEYDVRFKAVLNNLNVSCKVCSFQDTITSFVILSTESASQTSIPDLYIEKYGTPTTSRSYSGTKRWDFDNAEIGIEKHTTSKKRLELIPGRVHLKLNNPANKYREVTDTYFRMMSVTYSDKRQVAKVKEYEKKEAHKRDSLYKIYIKLRQDSINRAKEITKQGALNLTQLSHKKLFSTNFAVNLDGLNT